MNDKEMKSLINFLKGIKMEAYECDNERCGRLFKGESASVGLNEERTMPAKTVLSIAAWRMGKEETTVMIARHFCSKDCAKVFSFAVIDAL